MSCHFPQYVESVRRPSALSQPAFVSALRVQADVMQKYGLI